MPISFRDQQPTTRQQATQRPLPPEGQTRARIWYVVDLGIQHEEFTDPKTKKVQESYKPKIKIGMELPDCIMPPMEGQPSDRPFSLWKEFTWSMNSKKGKLAPFLFAIFGPRFKTAMETVHGREVEIGYLDGKEFQMKDLLGAYLRVTVVHNVSRGNGLTYANPGSFAEFPKPLPDDPPRYQYPKPYNENILFDLEDFNEEAFNKLYAWDRETIQAAKNWPTVAAPPDDEPQGAPSPEPDDIPF